MNHLSIRTALALALLAGGCKKAPDAAQPSSLQFTTKTFENVVPGCGDRSKREQPCVTFRVSWPEVSSAPDPAVQAKINAAIRARLQPKDAPVGFAAESAGVVEDYERFKKEFRNSEITYFVRRTAEVNFNNAHLLSVEINEEDFLGGAHPNTHREYVNLDPKTGESIALTNLLVRDGLAKLAGPAEARFRASKQIAADKKLSEAGYNFGDDKFALSKTWGVTPTGLVFYYNDYEIAPHYFGPTTIELPWSEIRPLIKKEAGLVPVQ